MNSEHETAGKYTLGKIRADIFRVLDEYSFNGAEHEMFYGGTGDIDKRLATALNSAIRLICLSTCSPERKKCVKVKFFVPKTVFEVKESELELYSCSKPLDMSNACALSFEYCGCGSISFWDSDGKKICEYPLSSEFGCFEIFRRFAPEGTHSAVVSAADGKILIKNVRGYEKDCFSGVYSDKNDEFLPDGNRLYCAVSPRLYEIVSVSGEVHGRKCEYPTDMIEYCAGKLSCEERFAGEYTIKYYEYPFEIPENAPLDTELELSPAEYSAAVYAAAAEICAEENGELYARLTYKYREILANRYPVGNCRRKNGFFAGGFFGRRKKGYDFFA